MGRVRGRRSVIAVGAVLGVLVIAALLTWRFKADVNSDDAHEPDGAAVKQVTAIIERRTLSALLTLPGTYSLDGPVEVRAPDPGEGERQVITGIPSTVGQSITAGSPVVEINYRPILLLQGALPLYRDVRPNMSGSDVTTLQQGLRQMGRVIPDEELGTFGPASQGVVRELYRTAGYEPDHTGGTAEATAAAVRAARVEADAAYRAMNAARANGEDTTELVTAHREAEEHADEVERTSGVMLRMDGVVTAPQGSLKVGSVDTEQGRTVSGGDLLVTLSAGDVALLATATPRQAALLGGGEARVVSPSEDCVIGPPEEAEPPPAAVQEQVGELDAGAPSSGEEGDVVVDGGTGAPDASAGPSGAAALQVRVLCLPPPPIERVGTDATVTVTVEVTGPDSLVVPATALVHEPDGSASVVVVERGEERRTPVTVVGEADGFVAIESQASVIAAGAHVVVTA